MDPRYSGKSTDKSILEASKTQAAKSSFSENSFKRTLKCWKCQGDHHLKHCPTATEDEKDSSLKSSNFRGKSKVPFSSPSFASKEKSSKTFSPATSSSNFSISKPFSGRAVESRGSVKTLKPLILKPGRILGRINDVLEIPILFHSGADENCIGENYLQRITDLGETVIVKNLDSPVYLPMAFQEAHVMIKSVAILTITFSTQAGRLRLRNVLTSVIEDDTMDEFILGQKQN